MSNYEKFREELTSMKYGDYLICTLDGERGHYRALMFYPDNDTVVVTNDGFTLTKVPLECILDLVHGCSFCDVVYGRTEHSKVPNVLSQEALKLSQGHNYCFNCGRKLR